MYEYYGQVGYDDGRFIQNTKARFGVYRSYAWDTTTTAYYDDVRYGYAGDWRFVHSPKKMETVGDTYIRAGSYTDYNYGSSSGLVVKTDMATDNNRQAIFTFDTYQSGDDSVDLSSLSAAYLNVYVTKCPADTVIEAHSIGNPDYTAQYSEDEITYTNFYKNAFKYGGGLELDSLKVQEAGKWVEFEVTDSVVISTIAQEDTMIYLRSDTYGAGQNYVFFESKEGLHRPYLRIENR